LFFKDWRLATHRWHQGQSHGRGDPGQPCRVCCSEASCQAI